MIACVILPDGEVIEKRLGMVPLSVPDEALTLGSPSGEVGRDEDEDAVAYVLTTDFLIGATEVTRDQYLLYASFDPSTSSDCDGSCPVESVSWHDAAWFTNLLSEAAGLSPCYECTGGGDDSECFVPDATDEGTDYVLYGCEGYRLPTEAEWEVAARGGSDEAFSTGGGLGTSEDSHCDGDVELSNGSVLDDHAWYCGNAEAVAPAGTLSPNVYGLFDVSGNVWEWTDDWYTDVYVSGPDPGGHDGLQKVVRGGAWDRPPADLRVANRGQLEPGVRAANVGFRVARSMR